MFGAQRLDQEAKSVNVYIHKELAEIRKTNTFVNSLIDDFKAYKKGNQPSYFGKDVPYHEPRPYAERAKLRHVHILGAVRAVRMKNTSDSVLIYTEASMTPNTYYVIDYIDIGAHKKANDSSYMEWLIEMAESFRMKV